MLAGLHSQLTDAFQSQELTRITRCFEHDEVDGHIIALGLRWFMMRVIDDRITYDGFQIFRCQDVIHIDHPSPRREFISRVFALRPTSLPQAPNIDLRNLHTILDSIQAQCELVTIHLEEIDEGICHIGKIKSTTTTQLVFHEIDPDANWESDLSAYEFDDITRIDLGSSYEAALALVALDNLNTLVNPNMDS